MKLRVLLLSLVATAGLSVVPTAAPQTRAATSTTGATVSPPSQPGPWRQLGAAVTSRRGQMLHFFRPAQNPLALGIVAMSSSSRPIYVFWASYCAFRDDDHGIENHQDTLTGVHSVIAYPPVLQDATICYVWVNARAPGKAKVTAAVFAY